MSFCKSCAEVHGIREQIFNALDPNSDDHPEMGASPSLGGPNMEVDWQRTCTHCGTTFEEFAQTGAVGCALCYDSFSDLLEPILRRMHGVIRRPAEGDVPLRDAASDDAQQTKLTFVVREDLEMELQLAILEEDYEKAAAIRDKIKHL